MSGNALIRPGTLFVLALGLLIGMGVYNWSEQLFPPPQQENARTIDCSNMQVEFVDRRDNGTHHMAFIKTDGSRPYAVTFYGEDRNVTRIVEETAPGSISRVSAPVAQVQDLKVKIDGCSRAFRP